MKVIVDTNVLLDVVLKREPFVEHSLAVIVACQKEIIEGSITTQTIADMFYLLRKDFTPKERRAILLWYCDIFQISSVDGNKMVLALKNENFSDLEDCLQSECAISFEADYIVTRNEKHFHHSIVPAISPYNFCKKELSIK